MKGTPLTRISDRLLAQDVDGSGVVVMDESTQEEVFVPYKSVRALAVALEAFAQTAMPWPETFDPEVLDFLDQATQDALPKIRNSAVTLQIAPGDEPDAKIAVELGFSLLLDKPIVVVVPEGRTVPEHLRRVADAVIPWDDDKDVMAKRVQDALAPFVEDTEGPA
jgi:hypothetical protein